MFKHRFVYCAFLISLLVECVQCNEESDILCSSTGSTSLPITYVCGCQIGWILVNAACEPLCSPSCFNGICVGPDKCKCYPGYEPPRGSRWRSMARYTCLPHPTTSTTKVTPAITEIESTTEISTTAFYKFYKETTRATYALPTSTAVEDSNVTRNTIKTTRAKEKCANTWIYVAIGLMVLLALLVLLVVLRHKLLICVKGATYVVSEQPPKRTQDPFNVSFSSISKK